MVVLVSLKSTNTTHAFFLSPRTKGELGPLQLALSGVVGGLVLSSGRRGVCYGLLQESVGADRRWGGRVVEEGDDILLSGLMTDITVSDIV